MLKGCLLPKAIGLVGYELMGLVGLCGLRYYPFFLPKLIGLEGIFVLLNGFFSLSYKTFFLI